MDEQTYYLTDAQYEVIEILRTTLEFVAVDGKYYSCEADEYSVYLGQCDERHLFNNDHVLEILHENGTFYLVEMGEIAEVPIDYYDDMKSIVKTYYKAK